MSIYDHLEFRHLKYIIAIADERSFNAAANHLHVAQSALSTQIKQLEDIFQIQIFRRERDGISPTPQGQVLLTFARKFVRGREDLINILQVLAADPRKPLSMGFSSFVEKQILADLNEALQLIAPDLEVTHDADETERLESRVCEGDLHCAVITLPVANKSLRMSVLDSERLVVCMREDDILARSDAVPTHASDERLCIFSYQQNHPAAYQRILELLKDVRITPKPCKPTTNLEHVQWLVKQRSCYALVRQGRPLMPGLTTRPIYGAKWTIDTALITANEPKHPVLTLLLNDLHLRATSTSIVAQRKPAVSTRRCMASSHIRNSQLSMSLPFVE